MVFQYPHTLNPRRNGVCRTVPAAALAQTAAAPAAAPEPDWTFTGNLGLYSQYVFRGISQTNEKPAVQGGFDLGHKSGFYAGTWASNVSWIADVSPPNPPPAPSASMEWDFYGGYKGSLPADFAYDLGVLYYWYPGSYPSGFTKPEHDGALRRPVLEVAVVQVQLERRTTRRSASPIRAARSYLDLTASYDIIEKVSDVIGKVTIFGHVGKQYFHNNSFYDYSDWKVGASTEIYGVTVGIYGTGHQRPGRRLHERLRQEHLRRTSSSGTSRRRSDPTRGGATATAYGRTP